ncbi:multiple epidermal growth factor-like domains protein 9 isoform X2 [Syngnathoides biaculeatus]|uniref:multiple epidermal growth factor-like domains protein 9 isoform X2 n=1 Tax=Syngnathoides biaculeatus TaxID=300417 RepID=UPI002ADD88C0|nr:multiple epidermal growth factor-like domains protein 9 isoform X2 [Syngnathoides biaculeatus]
MTYGSRANKLVERHQRWSTHPFRRRSDRDHRWGLHGELRLNMRLTSLIMYISLAVVFLLSVYIEFSEAAPRISLYDASTISGKPDTASDTWESLLMHPPRRFPDNSFPLTQSSGLGNANYIPQNSLISATTEPTTTDFHSGIILRAKEDNTALLISRLSALRKRSTDAHTALFAPEKMLQTMMSMVSQRTHNYAWSADRIDTSAASVENPQDDFCNCSTGGEGILYPEECNQSTGHCSCLEGYSGLQCDNCEEGYFTNGTSGCLPCACDSFGAVSHLCDSSGMCVCKAGVYGPKCDECHPGFFHFSSTGCQPCQCHNQTNYCHPQSGVCLNCEGNTQGSNCEECKPDHYRGHSTPLNEACVPCPCSNSSSTGNCHTDPSGFPVCDQCLHHYSGPLCDHCSAGFYKASGACVPCDCSGNADLQGPRQLCNPDTGHCFRCINNTTGPQCQLCAPGFAGDARAHNCSRLMAQHIPTPAGWTTTEASSASRASSSSNSLITTKPRGTPVSIDSGSWSTTLSTSATTQALLTSLSSPTDNTTAVLTDISWTQFNIIILAVIILVVVVLLGFVGGVYTYREYQNRKLNAPFWTIELKEDNISFSSYHDSIPNADVSGLLEDEANEVAPNGQLALTTQGNCYKA